MVQRFGFCCKWLNDTSEFGGMKVNAKDRELNGRSTTTVGYNDPQHTGRT